MSYDPSPVAVRPAGTSLPVCLLAVTAAIYLATQIAGLAEQSKLLHWQLTNSDKQLDNLHQTETQLKEAAVQRESTVKQATDTFQQTESLLTDVLDLAKTDDDTKAIVENHHIQRAPAPADTKTDAAKPADKPAAK